MEYEAVIGLEVHAELETRSKMFCACPVVDPTTAAPNSAVCPVCSGMPGVLPVVNQRAVEFALRVALALECEIAHTSIFARKNYFYPDLPKGYQISQYEHPLARNGLLPILTTQGGKIVRIRRVHLEEDTGKLTHINQDGTVYTLVDLNRAGIPLLEIVSEPDLHTPEEVRAYVVSLRAILRYLGVNSGDLQKGVLRIEPNVSVRPKGSETLGTRVEIKNLNSFRALERSLAFEIERQITLLKKGGMIRQETVGWDEAREMTVVQRVKEGEDDYRYFPEPDLPPLVIEPSWIESIRAALPELPYHRYHRFQQQYALTPYDAGLLVAEKAVADYFEEILTFLESSVESANRPKIVANWVTGELFGLLNQSNIPFENNPVSAQDLAALIGLRQAGVVNQTTAKAVLAEMFNRGRSADEIIGELGLEQISDPTFISSLVEQVLRDHPQQVSAYLRGKRNIFRWLFGQVMRAAQNKANPQILRHELERRLVQLEGNDSK